MAPRAIAHLKMDVLLDRYRVVEALLDRELEACRAELNSAGFTIIDRSNRPGWRGEPPCWSHDFERRARDGNLVDLVQVTIDYALPLRDYDAVTICRSCERLRILGSGQSKRHTRSIPSADFRPGDLLRLVKEEAAIAMHELSALGAA